MIEGSVYGGTEVVERFKALPASLRTELRETIAKLSVKLATEVKAKLNNGVLHWRSGLLWRSIKDVTIESGDSVSGIVSTAVKYARVHEYGGTVSIRAHLRTIKTAFGRSINPVTFEVRAHNAIYPERSFLRSSLREMEAAGTIRDAMAAAVKKAIL